jgi:metal-sulfur cluster biosynthetic enzyme
MNGGPKENANPTVLRVEKLSRRREPIGWSTLLSLPADNGAASSTDLAILQALQDASAATGGKGVSLLRNLGLSIPENNVEPKKAVAFPVEFGVSIRRRDVKKEKSEVQRDAIDADEIFEIIGNIQDPEHPLTLEQLGVVSRSQITVQDFPDEDGCSKLDVRFTPTIPHCSMATLIGLCIRVKLLRSLPSSDRFKVTVRIEPGTHNSESSVNKQLSDKERVCAALENKHLLGVVNKCIAAGMNLSSS